ncbi:MAG: trigger factor [Lentisphaeria bacterium]|nr:trigger factor [Lentisphaeria bacterium]
MAVNLATSLNMEVRDDSACRKVYTFTVAKDVLSQEWKRSLAEVARYVNIPGFRRGKAPVAMLKSKYASDIEGELKRRLLYTAFDKINEDKDLDIVSCNPEGDLVLKEGEDLTFVLNVDLAPVFDAGDYKNVKVELPAADVTDEQINERLDFYRTMYAGYTEVQDFPAQAEDMLKVDYTSDFELAEDASPALRRQVAAEGSYLWLNEPEIIPGAIQALTGATVGGEYEFAATYAEDYREEALAGKTLNYKVKVNSVQRKQALSDAELCEKAQVKDMDEFRTQLRAALENEAQNKRRGELIDKVYEAVDGAVADFELPPSILDGEISRELRKMAGEMVKSEADAEEFKAKQEEHRATAAEAAKKALRRTFILRQIAKLENITISREEVDARVKGISGYYGYKEKELRAMLEKSGGMEELQLDILNAKVLEFLADKADANAK